MDDGSIVVTGSADSRLVVWHDRTEEVKIAEAAALQTKELQDQQLQNLLQNEQLLPALKMSITLERPNTALKIIQSNTSEIYYRYFKFTIIIVLLFLALSKQGQGQDLEMLYQNINLEHKEKLFDYVVNWNCNGKYCLAAQVFKSIIFVYNFITSIFVSACFKYNFGRHHDREIIY